MPLGKNVKKNIKELFADNKKLGKAKGANGKPRSQAQIVAIAYAAAKRPKKKRNSAPASVVRILKPKK